MRKGKESKLKSNKLGTQFPLLYHRKKGKYSDRTPFKKLTYLKFFKYLKLF